MCNIRFILNYYIFGLVLTSPQIPINPMKNLKLLMMSFVILTFFSCSEETIKQDAEVVSTTKSTTTTQKILAEDCSSPTLIGAADATYNCFGLAFSLSETGEKKPMDNAEIYAAYIDSGLFKEDYSNKATKVLYWNELAGYNAKDYRAVDHAAIITDSGNTTVYSKQGLTGLYRNCIGYYYLNTAKSYYRTYSLNVDLNTPSTAPVRGQTFTVSLQHFAAALEVNYVWTYNTTNLELVSNDGSSITLKVKETAAAGSYNVGLSATHQRNVIINNASFPKTVTSSYNFTLASNTPAPPTASFTGSTYVTKTSMGSWSATVSGGTAPYQLTWWLKRQQDPDSFYLQVGAGSDLYLLTKTSIKSTYYNLYFRVIDANGQSFSTQPMVVQSTGVLEEAL